ncbi:MAG: c-type cytochrome [Verrucomicrobiae bacterium]|nr:c-type cytochrome [Verrucomicrobiae bacterium]
MGHRLRKQSLLCLGAGMLVWGHACLAPAADGAALFAKNCAPCHGPKGKPNAKMTRLLGVRDLTQSRIAEAEIERQILEGRQEGARQVMPAFKESLKEEEIRALVQHVLRLRK